MKTKKKRILKKSQPSQQKEQSIRLKAVEYGIYLDVRELKHGRRKVSYHWMFNDANKKRLLDYWTNTGTVRIRESEYRKGELGVKTPEEALEFAKSILDTPPLKL